MNYSLIDEHPLFKHCLDKNYDLTSISMKEFNDDIWCIPFFVEEYIQRFKRVPDLTKLTGIFNFDSFVDMKKLAKETTKIIIENQIDISNVYINGVYKCKTHDVFIKYMIENCIDMGLNIRDIKGLTDEDIKRHINEIVYCYYSLNKEVPNDLLFDKWYKQPFINYHPLDVKQYTPLQSWLMFNHNNTEPPKEFQE